VKPIVLASSSLARAAVLRAAGLNFRIEPSAVDEAAVKSHCLAEGLDVAAIAGRLATSKALDRAGDPATLVIGADQTLEVNEALLDKTASLAETRERLLSLRGRPFSLHCAVAGAVEGRVLWSHTETARLAFREFSEAYLDAYLQRNADALRVSLGGFELEGEGVQLLEWVDGDYFAILGLPLLPLLAWLRRAGGAPL
jgi:septum formation protein